MPSYDHPPRLPGEAHPHARLREADIPVIRRAYANGVTQKELAEEYHVSHATIGNVVHRKTWRHLPDLTPIQKIHRWTAREWEYLRLTEDQPADAVARTLGRPVSAVYQARYRMRKEIFAD